jgi:hypothetical protein
MAFWLDSYTIRIDATGVDTLALPPKGSWKHRMRVDRIRLGKGIQETATYTLSGCRYIVMIG